MALLRLFLKKEGCNVNHVSKENFEDIYIERFALELVKHGYSKLDNEALLAHWECKEWSTKELKNLWKGKSSVESS